MQKLARFLHDYKRDCITGATFKFMEVIFELLLPTVMALIINRGVDGKNTSYVLKMGAVMIGMAILGYCCALVCQYLASRASQGFGTLLRDAVFRRILDFSGTQIDEFGAPTLTNRITNDVNQLQSWVAMMIRLIPRAPFICVGSIVMSFFLNPRLALILLASTPAFGLIIFLITKNAAPLYRRYQQMLDRIADSLRENLSGVRVIRAFSKTETETRRFAACNDTLTETGYSIGNISALFNPLTSLVVNVVILLILWVGGIHISLGNLSQGQIIAFLNYVNQILYALLVVSNLIILLTKSMASAGRINEILDTESGMVFPSAEMAPASVPDIPAVRFDNVSFGYNRTGEKALEGIRLDVRKGETLGIIGGTGSGKTTLVSLISRAYDTDEGNVLVDGVNVRDYPAETLRKKVGIVPQKALLFTGTVAENIRWGRADAPMEKVLEASRTAQAEEFIETLPEGYGTPVERGGANLSGGQRQRVTIARALVADPEILILDDASSALDYLTDARLRAAIRKQSSGMTVLIVSQRVGAVRSADRIVVLEDGKIVGIGPHKALLKDCPTYRDICLSQLSDGEAEA
jgi:ATP-binding cassette, subfamily B, multidrug efflux pump